MISGATLPGSEFAGETRSRFLVSASSSSAAAEMHFNLIELSGSTSRSSKYLGCESYVHVRLCGRWEIGELLLSIVEGCYSSLKPSGYVCIFVVRVELPSQVCDQHVRYYN